MVKIGVIGAGHLGKIHIRLLKEIPGVELVGFFDHNEEHARAVSTEFGIKSFSTCDELFQEVDAVDIDPAAVEDVAAG